MSCFLREGSFIAFRAATVFEDMNVNRCCSGHNMTMYKYEDLRSILKVKHLDSVPNRCRSLFVAFCKKNTTSETSTDLLTLVLSVQEGTM